MYVLRLCASIFARVYLWAAEQFQVNRELLSPPVRNYPSSSTQQLLLGRECVCSGHYIRLKCWSNCICMMYMPCGSPSPFLRSLSLPPSLPPNTHTCMCTHPYIICTYTLCTLIMHIYTRTFIRLGVPVGGTLALHLSHIWRGWILNLHVYIT